MKSYRSAIATSALFCVVGITAVVQFACGNNDHHAGADTYNQHACDHLKFGPLVKIVPADSPATATEITVMSDQEIDLQASGAGYVKIAAATKGAGLYGIFLTAAAVKARLQDASGTTLQPASTASSVPQCESIQQKAIYELPAADHFLKLDPPAGATAAVNIHLVVVEPGDGRNDQ